MQEIEDETKRHLAKTRKIVSPAPIQLTVYSPNVPNLTLVDMPGAVSIAAGMASVAMLSYTRLDQDSH